MSMNLTRKAVFLGTAVALATLTACGGDSSSAPTPTPGFSSTQFSFFTEQVFGASANSTPVSLNGLTFNFDVNDDPSAFNYALM